MTAHRCLSSERNLTHKQCKRQVCHDSMPTVWSVHTAYICAVFSKEFQCMWVIVLHRLRNIDHVTPSIKVSVQQPACQQPLTILTSEATTPYNRLNSLRSAWTRRHSWYIVRISLMHWRYKSPYISKDKLVSFSFGAGLHSKRRSEGE